MESIVQVGIWKGVTGSLLAERELACLLSIASGMTDKEIAKRDGVSPRSVKGRIESVMHKLGIYRRAALVAEAIRCGLIVTSNSPSPTGPNHRESAEHKGVFIA